MAEVENLNEVYGFKRAEMYSTNIANSITPYGRHVFLQYKSPESWIFNVEEEGLPQRFAKFLKSRKADLLAPTKLNVYDGDGSGSDGDVLIFPDMIRYKGVKDTNADAFFEDVLVNGKPWGSGIQEELSGSFVFVCNHANRDMRCGVCGPIITEKFKQEIASRGLVNQISLKRCSHVGQHKYAGNLIIFCPDSTGKITGNWYGYVTPEDVPQLLDQHIAKGEIIQRIWRGKMGIAAADAPEKVQDPNVNNREADTGGCCKGAEGVSCCQNQP